MPKWCNWQTQRFQKPPFAGSSPAFGTILIILFTSLFCSAKQDGEDYGQRTELEQLKVDYELLTTEMAGVKADLERAYRPHAKNLIERILMQRFLAPVDLWIMNPNIAKEPFPTREDYLRGDGVLAQRWYTLIIEPENTFKNPKIWVKFYIDYGEYMKRPENSMEEYVKWRRNSLLEVLEYQFVTMLDDPEGIQTMIDGTPHLYRLVTKDTDIEKLRKEDRIY